MKKILLLLSITALIFTYISCSKSDPEPPANPCAGVTVGVTATITHADIGQNNGVITAVATGGTGFTYSIDGGAFQASGTFSNLAAGVHTVSAKTSAGCTGSAQFTVNTINACIGVTVTVTGVVTNASIANNDGSITITATGGTGFTYNINSGTFQAGNIFSNLAAGVYTIIAKNSNGCTGTAQFTVTNPCSGVTVTVTGVVTNATASNNDGSITVTATGGTGFTYNINGGTFQANNIFSNLAAGVYTIIAKNSNGCTGTAQFTVTNPCTGVTVTVTGVVTNTTTGQSNGSINASATGGTGPYTFSINGGTFQASGLFSNLAVGIYNITAKSSAGCPGTAQFTVTTTNPCTGVVINVTTTVTNATQCVPANGGISVSATGGTGPYTYSIGGTFQASNVFNSLAPNSYTITVKDANGCNSTPVNATVASAPTGPLFNAVKAVLATNCALSGCHVGPTPQNGIDFTDNCTIVLNNTRIKERAVDGNPSFMPPPPNPQLSAADKQKIVNWVNAGGQANN